MPDKNIEQRNFFLCGSDACFMAIEGLVTSPSASLGPQTWAEPAVEGGRTTVDESLTALPRPVYLRPPDGATCRVGGALLGLIKLLSCSTLREPIWCQATRRKQLRQH